MSNLGASVRIVAIGGTVEDQRVSYIFSAGENGFRASATEGAGAASRSVMVGPSMTGASVDCGVLRSTGMKRSSISNPQAFTVFAPSRL